MNIYLAGGAVRDILLGRRVSDRDYLVTGIDKDSFAKTFPQAREVGVAFPVFLVEGLEFSFPRAASLEKEVKARDLTVNAMLVDDEGELFCHPDALDDLHARLLRPTSRQAFHDDPLRVFRAARFWAKLPEFQPTDELVALMHEVAESGALKDIAPDRIGQETRKALRAKMPGNYLRLLGRTGCLSPWYEELAKADGIPAGPPPYHDADVLEHTCRVMDFLSGDEIQVWMGLTHDIGKCLTPEDQWPHHFGHDMAGEAPAEALGRRIRLPNLFIEAGAKAARWHMNASRYDELKPGTRVDMLMALNHGDLVEPMFALVRADNDQDHGRRPERDLRTILGVRLAPEDCNQGEASGIKLRQLRAKALKDRDIRRGHK